MKQPFISYALISLSVSILGLSACGTNDNLLKATTTTDNTNTLQNNNNVSSANLSSGTNTGEAKVSNASVSDTSSNPNIKMVSQDEFDRLKKSPAFILLDEAQIKRSEEDEKRKLAENQSILIGLLKTNPDRADLFNSEPSPNDPNIKALEDGNYLLKIKNSTGEEQSVTTLGKSFKVNTIASAIKTFPTMENQLEIYKGVFDSLPEDEKEPADTTMSIKATTGTFSTVPTSQKGTPANSSGSINSIQKDLFPRPERLAKMSINDIRDYNLKISRRLYDMFRIKLIDPNIPSGYVSTPANEEGAGNGNDRTNSDNPSCTTHKDNGIFKKFQWSNKYFVTSVKNQGHRGTCVAFAITSADEMKIARDNNRWVNLSEQDYYYKNKAAWWPSSYGDGLDTFLTWQKLKTTGYRMPYENDWNYNPSYSRTENNTTHTYTHSCDGYGEECSNTNHQGAMTCVDTPVGRVCGTMSGASSSNPYTLPGTIQEIWNHSNTDLSVALAAINVALGHPVVVSLQVTPSFDSPDANGYVHYAGASEGSRGGHALHVTGFISNEVLASKIPSAPAGAGGGYFIIKNSWGTCFGDAGYIYLPFDWIKKYTYSMTVRN